MRAVVPPEPRLRPRGTEHAFHHGDACQAPSPVFLGGQGVIKVK